MKVLLSETSDMFLNMFFYFLASLHFKIKGVDGLKLPVCEYMTIYSISSIYIYIFEQWKPPDFAVLSYIEFLFQRVPSIGGYIASFRKLNLEN